MNQWRHTSFAYYKSLIFQNWFNHRTRACRRDLFSFFEKENQISIINTSEISKIEKYDSRTVVKKHGNSEVIDEFLS